VTTSIELVAFDLGNVLCTVDEMPVANELASLSGRPADEVFEVVFGKPRKALFESGKMTFAEHAERAIAALGVDLSISEFTKLYDSVLIPSDDMFPLVAKIADQRRIALVSNTSEPHWKAAEKFLPFSSKLDPVIISCDVDAMKPDPAFYDALLSQSNVEPGNILFVDDLAVNIDGARNMGMIGHQFTSQAGFELALADLGII
jgi:FMN phosphatase YigB (HAD superfamily)